MTTKGWIVLSFLILAIVLFILVGFDILTWDNKNLAALGLASFVGAVVVHLYMGGSELKA